MKNIDVINFLKKELKDEHCSHKILFNIIKDYIENDEELKPYVHSFKYRIKDIEHLDEKITRKNQQRESDNLGFVDINNVFNVITDIFGIRILHLHHNQLKYIHEFFMKKINEPDNLICLYEQPKAYGWDPEYKEFFETLKIEYHQKETSYTSVHYVFQHKKDSRATCEVQVRTLCEELWGEVDHLVNYPKKTDNPAIKEMLGVFSKIVGASVKVSNSIFNLIEKEKL